MKKKKIIITIILLVLLVFSITANYRDSARVRAGYEPKLTLKIINKKANKVTYWGFGYKVIRYPSINADEPYRNNKGVKFGTWFMTYKLPSNNNLEIKSITDKTKTMINFACAEVLSSFYEDEFNIYYFDCMKNKYVIVKYKDNSEETVSDALKNNHIKISDLDKYNIKYIKERK